MTMTVQDFCLQNRFHICQGIHATLQHLLLSIWEQFQDISQAENGRDALLTGSIKKLGSLADTSSSSINLWTRIDMRLSHHLGKPVTLPFLVQLDFILVPPSLGSWTKQRQGQKNHCLDCRASLRVTELSRSAHQCPNLCSFYSCFAVATTRVIPD